MRDRLACLAIAAAFAAPACDVAAMGPQSREHFSETRRLEPTGTVTVDNTNGAVAVETWNEPSVSIEADKVGPQGELADIRIEVQGEGGRVDVRTHQPRGNWGRHGHVEYRIRVPEQARLEVETTNGAVRVTGTSGDVRAVTTNGAVDVSEAAGNVEASTTNGAVRAAFRRAPDGGWQRMSTTNGSVTLTLPAEASGTFDARTVNGSISTDFPLEVSGRIGRRLHGRIGQGTTRFDLRTVNGAIKVLKAGG